MVKVLLSCDAVDFDIALSLKASFREKFGFKVFLDVDAWDGQEDEHQRQAFDEEFENRIDGAAVLLVFEFGESSLSAWVMLEETDERDTRGCNPRKKLFPEVINFGKGYSRGLRIFENILIDDFGLLNTRRSSKSKSTKQVEQNYYYPKKSASSSPHTASSAIPSTSMTSTKRRPRAVFSSIRGRH